MPEPFLPPRPAGAAPGADAPDPAVALRELFGWPAFRPGQEDVVRRVLAGRDTLAVMPTGAGKSLCYQLPAMLRTSPTLVISPLIALMRDQVEHVPPALRERVTFINSTLEAAEVAERLAGLRAGRIQLLYAAPERLRQPRFLATLRDAGVGLVVVDEAHCVALWGHDFRPDYMFIRAALAGPLRGAAVLAMTATATLTMANEIGLALGRDLDLVRQSVVRDNLTYVVQPLDDEEAKLRFVVERIPGLAGSGIVYARARDRCERIAALLRGKGVAAAHYHAQLEPAARSATQAAFVRDEIRVVVATTAFGMGVDKPDIRFVLLYNYPTSLEEYVQQVGRAGRDGAPATCTLLATRADATNLRTFARRDLPSVEELRGVWSRLRAAARGGAEVEVGPEDLREAAGLPEGREVRVHCGVLERAGLIERHTDAGRAMRFAVLPPPADAAGRVAAIVERMRTEALERARGIIAFAETATCRHLQVAQHFGDVLTPPCDHCDVCRPATGSRLPPARQAPIRELPDDPAQAILDAVAALRWPLGVRGLVALLRGSVDAPPSARGLAAFGLLEAVPAGTVRRWIQALGDTGHLVRQLTDDGFPVLGIGPDPVGDIPRLAAPRGGGPAGRGRGKRGTRQAAAGEVPDALEQGAQATFERLRSWRAAEARQGGVPAYLILNDRTLREIAQARPGSLMALERLPGIGPSKLARWGEAVLALVRED